MPCLPVDRHRAGCWRELAPQLALQPLHLVLARLQLPSREREHAAIHLRARVQPERVAPRNAASARLRHARPARVGARLQQQHVRVVVLGHEDDAFDGAPRALRRVSLLHARLPLRRGASFVEPRRRVPEAVV